MMLWFLGLALAKEPAPCVGLEPPPQTLSVAWVSPIKKRTGSRHWLLVTPTIELRQKLEPQDNVGRLLQLLGMRKRAKIPKTPYKVVVFEVDAALMCRPLEGYLPYEEVTGIPVCPGSYGRATPRYSGCGYSTDWATEERGVDLYRVQWRDAVRGGFCVLPAERFLSAQ